MTTRHTISHADELYSGNAYLDAYSPDGRRGLFMTHLYVREYGAITALDSDGIIAASAQPSAVIATFAVGENLIGGNATTLCTGALALVTAGSTTITLDVPRNIVILLTAVNANKVKINVEGRDEYNQKMCESIICTGADAYSSGMKAFKYLDKIFASFAITVGICVGTGNRIGLPFHLSSLGKFMGVSIDGSMTASVVGGVTMIAVTTGLTLGTVDSTSENAPDVRGTFRMISGPVPDGTRVFSALMVVDHTTREKAFGPTPATAIT